MRDTNDTMRFHPQSLQIRLNNNQMEQSRVNYRTNGKNLSSIEDNETSAHHELENYRHRYDLNTPLQQKGLYWYYVTLLCRCFQLGLSGIIHKMPFG